MRKSRKFPWILQPHSPATWASTLYRRHIVISRPLQAVLKYTAGPQMLPDTGLPRGGWDTCWDKEPKKDAIVPQPKERERSQSRRSYAFIPKFNLAFCPGNLLFSRSVHKSCALIVPKKLFPICYSHTLSIERNSESFIRFLVAY